MSPTATVGRRQARKPRVLSDTRRIECSCGAVWLGKYVDSGAEIIRFHREQQQHTLVSTGALTYEQPPQEAEMQRFHIMLKSGEERDVTADRFDVDAGTLVFRRGTKDAAAVLAYAEGEWSAVEVERLDDKA